MLADLELRRRLCRSVRNSRHAAGQARGNQHRGDRRHQDHLPLSRPGHGRTAQRDQLRSAAAPAVQEPGAVSTGIETRRAIRHSDDGALHRFQHEAHAGNGVFLRTLSRGAARRGTRRQPGRQRRFQQRVGQPHAAPGWRRPVHAGDRHAAGTVPLCRHALVLHALWAGRHHHRAADAVAGPGAGARGAEISGGPPGDCAG